MNTKTIFKMLAAAMLMPAMLLTTACSSDDDAVNDNANTQKKYYEIPVTVTVTRQGDEGTRATYTYDEVTKEGTLSFSAGDKLFVNGAIDGETEAYPFAGALDLVSATDGTFEGTVVCTQPYTGKAKAFLEDPDIHTVTATLLPAGYTNYSYLRLAEITPYTNVSAMIENSLLPLGKAEAVAQLSYEYAFDYNNSVFALAPLRPVICCTISGLPTNTDVQVAYDGRFDISGKITTDGSGTATFAFTNSPGYNLGTLTVNGNAITLPSNVKLEAGKVYTKTATIQAAAPAARPLAEATTDDLGKIAGADGNIYDTQADAAAAGTTAVAMIAYVGEETDHATYKHGLALALADESQSDWSTAVSTCAAKNTSTPVAGASWMLPSRPQWEAMGATEGSSTRATLRDGFSNVGGTNMQANVYWSSTEKADETQYVYYYYFGNDDIYWLHVGKDYPSGIDTRACLVF